MASRLYSQEHYLIHLIGFIFDRDLLRLYAHSTQAVHGNYPNNHGRTARQRSGGNISPVILYDLGIHGVAAFKLIPLLILQDYLHVQDAQVTVSSRLPREVRIQLTVAPGSQKRKANVKLDFCGCMYTVTVVCAF